MILTQPDKNNNSPEGNPLRRPKIIFGDVETIKNTFDELKRDLSWDSCLCTHYTKEMIPEQKSIFIYRFRKGMKHNKGQLLSIKGQPITAPQFRVKELSRTELYSIHYRNENAEYLKAKQKYWRENA